MLDILDYRMRKLFINNILKYESTINILVMYNIIE